MKNRGSWNWDMGICNCLLAAPILSCTDGHTPLLPPPPKAFNKTFLLGKLWPPWLPAEFKTGSCKMDLVQSQELLFLYNFILLCSIFKYVMFCTCIFLLATTLGSLRSLPFIPRRGVKHCWQMCLYEGSGSAFHILCHCSRLAFGVYRGWCNPSVTSLVIVWVKALVCFGLLSFPSTYCWLALKC